MTLEEFFRHNSRLALGFSGGVDSAFLLYKAVELGVDIRAYYVTTEFQPAFEQEDVLRLAGEIGADLVSVSEKVLFRQEIADNSRERCYHCKTLIFGRIKELAAEDGYPLLIDGTNASDDVSDRPGYRALQELGVRSPLRECGLTKQEIRKRSKEMGLSVWDKPAYACLATRIETGSPITEQKLRRIEGAEEVLRALGFSDFRVRMRGEGEQTALLQMLPCQIPHAARLAEEIRLGLAPYFREVTLDLRGREHE